MEQGFRERCTALCTVLDRYQGTLFSRWSFCRDANCDLIFFLSVPTFRAFISFRETVLAKAAILNVSRELSEGWMPQVNSC